MLAVAVCKIQNDFSRRIDDAEFAVCVFRQRIAAAHFIRPDDAVEQGNDALLVYSSPLTFRDLHGCTAAGKRTDLHGINLRQRRHRRRIIKIPRFFAVQLLFTDQNAVCAGLHGTHHAAQTFAVPIVHRRDAFAG